MGSMTGIRFQTGSEVFSSPPRPYPLWGPPSLLCNGYRGLYSWPLTSIWCRG